MRASVPLESSYQSTRLDANRQQTLNLFPNTLRGYRQFPGHVTFASFQATGETLTDSNASAITDAAGDAVDVSVTPGGADRGMIANGPNGLLYQVTGSALYSIDNSGTAVFIGEIRNSPTPVVMATDANQLIITTGGTPDAYVYTVAGGLAEISDGDLLLTSSVAFLDSRFIYQQPDGFFVVSALNDGTSIAALDFAQAESLPDDLLRVFSLNQLLYLFGETTTEIWFTSGTGRPPLSRQAVITQGICGTYAVDSIDGIIYFIDGNRRPGMIQGENFQPLFVPAIGEEWASFGATDFATARVTAYSLHQETFVDFIFSEQGQIWTYHVTSQTWFEKDFMTTSIVHGYDLVLAAHSANKKIYRLDFSNFQQDGENMTRRKDLPLISSEVMDVGGAEMVIDKVKLHLDTSTSSSVSLKVSKDLNSFSTINTMTVDGNKTIDINSIGKSREIIVRVETASNAKVDVLDAAIDAQILEDDMGQLTQTTTQLQTILDDADASNAGNTSISDASDTTATSLKKSGFYALQASSSNAPSTDRAVLISAVRNTTATGEIRYGQLAITESNGLWWNADDGGSLGTWYESVGTAATQTLTNKTLTSPVLTTPQINDSSADHQYVFASANLAADRTVSLPLLTGNDSFVFEAHTQTLTNKTLTAPLLSAPVLSGTSSAAGSILFKEDTDNGTNAVTLIGPAATSDVTVTLPAATDTLVGKATTDTLTNKTLTAPVVSAPVVTGGSINNTPIGASTASTVVATQVDITAQGDLRLQDSSGGEYVAMQAPATLSSSYTLTMPGNDGDNNQVLQTNGSGVLSWVNVSSAGIADGSITTAKLADDAVTSAKLAHALDVVTSMGIGGGSSNGVAITQGAIAIKNGGAQSYVDFYCESSNAHYARILAPAHSAFSGNVTLTLPATTSNLVGDTATQTLTNKTLTSAVLNTGVSGTAILDEDNMASDSATKLATQQSIKAYVDNNQSGVTASSTTTFTNKTLTAAKIVDGGFLADANGNELIKMQTTGSAVNELELTNAATGGAVVIGTSGGDDNIDLTLTPKGTGEVNVAAGNFNYAGTAVTATGAELNYLDIATLGLTAASKAVTADANGVITLDNGFSEEYAAVTSSSNAVSLDLRTAGNFSHDLTENTTISFANPAASGKVSGATLRIIQGSTARTITWNSSIKWASDTAPTLSTANDAVDVFVFYTVDGGTNYYGFTAGQVMS